ncbi:MAG: pitrilysin family protein, partial [Vicinamibacterales bacterium]
MRVAVIATVAASLTLLNAQGAISEKGSAYEFPIAYFTLPNGLKVVLSPDRSMQTVRLAMVYRVGSRDEAQNRTGMAHLFEHLMFQGSENLGPAEYLRLVRRNGGISNGTTRHDSTAYFQDMPAHQLAPALWAEADRLRALRLTEAQLNAQKHVVVSEVKENVLNQPYARFPRLVLWQRAFSNWHNAHNSYGKLEDITAVTLPEAQAFYRRYYIPGNAALALVGNFEESATRRLIDRYFGSLPRLSVAARASFDEPQQMQEKRHPSAHALSTRPALGIAYQMPPVHTPEYYAMGVIDALLLQGDDALLRRELQARIGDGSQISGGIHIELGNMFNYAGPMLWIASLPHDPNMSADDILGAINAVISKLQSEPLDPTTMQRLIVKVRSSLYDRLLPPSRADLLATFALFHDAPARINELETQFRAVTPRLIQQTARDYLRVTNRTIVEMLPGAGAPSQSTQASVLPPLEPARAEVSPAASPRQRPPPGDQLKPFPISATETIALPTGFTATLVPWGAIPKAVVHLVVDVGDSDERDDQRGLAELTANVLREGTTLHDASALSGMLAGIGGSLRIVVNPDQTSLATDVLSDSVTDAVAILAEVLQRPAFPAAQLSRLRQTLLSKASLAKTTAAGVAQERFASVLYGAHPYGRTAPSREQLEPLTIEDLQAFHESRFRAARAHLYVLGQFSAPLVKRAVTDAFGQWAAGESAKRQPVAGASTGTVHVVDRPQSSQATLNIGLPVISPAHNDYVTLTLVTTLLRARISENIRERKGYTYSPRTQLVARPAASHWIQTADVSIDTAGAALAEIFKEVQRVRVKLVAR